ncbi:UDP-glucose 4-epimerase GalE [Limnoglobus roseus]|uniref:UDP-glucose 4-epimerase n=1 Tax=Limnoglobus roseus TaxID=2598579 RepID=A0A5C1A9N7_9BACT|nr:UDP-glucose 4-epimerase GalE [Limnoglobus roseus]QEL13834.1 UDP-glucose 4-epimerase GalE [Limnoglobus roseus]
MRILVTGGAGYIGSHTVKLLLARGHAVTVYDNLSFGHRDAVPKETLVVGDLKDIDHLDQIMVVNQIEAVIHFAAFAYVGESVTNPAKYYQNNLLNSMNLLERVRRLGIPRFVFSSTCATYGVPTAMPITEDEKQSPINPYGNSKFCFEKMLADYAAAYPLGFTALRYFNASGAAPDGSIGEDHTPETHLIPLVLQVALGQRPHIEIFGTDYPTSDGTCIRDYIHVDDLAEAHLLALEKIQPNQGNFYNVGIGRGYSVREVIQVAEEVTGKKIAVKEAPRRAGDPPSLVAGSDKIRRELGWQPKYTQLRAILETAWNWHKAHPKGYGDK